MKIRSWFGWYPKEPFLALQNLSVKVKQCADEVPSLFDAFYDGDYELVRTVADRMSHLENEADVVKNKARDLVPQRLGSVDRRDYLDVLSSLDAIADCAEDVGILFTLREMEPHDELMSPLRTLVRRVMATVHKACEMMAQMDALFEANFGGDAARDTLLLVEELGRLEHEADIVQDDLARRLFAMEDDIKPGSLFIWNKIFNKLGDMANHAERTGNRLRLFLA